MGYQTIALAAPKETERKDVNEISPTLIVGVGGTGKEILLRLRRRFVEAFGDLKNFPIVGYIYVDTAVAIPLSQSGVDRDKDLLMPKIKFGQDEWVPASVNTAYYVDNINKYDHIKRWLPLSGELKNLGELSIGAGQIRPASRLAFFDKFNAIQNTLEKAKGSIADPKHSETMKPLKITIDPSRTFIYLVCSLAGGTGSGMFLDVAHLIKKVFGDNIDLVGYLVLPQIFGEDKTMANAYAALKELNHYKFKNQFIAQWHPDMSEKSFAPPPFNYCYLIDAENESGARIQDPDTLYRMVADNIFQDFSHSTFSGHKREVKVNLVQYLNRVYTYCHTDLSNREVMQEAFPCRYSAFGITSIAIPADRIINSCASRLAADIISYWSSEAGNVGVEKVTQELMNHILPTSMRFLEGEYRPPEGGQVYDRHDILDGLCEKIELEIAQWADQLQQDILNGAPDAAGVSWQAYLEDRIRNEESLFKGIDEADPNKWGDYRATLEGRMDKLIERFGNNLDKTVTEIVSNQYQGPGFALAALRRMKEILNSEAFKYMPKFKSLAEVTLPAREDELGTQINNAKNQIAEVEGWGGIDPRRFLRQTNLETILKERLIPNLKQHYWTKYLKRACALAYQICEEAIRLIGSDADPENEIEATGQIAKIKGLIAELDKMRKTFQDKYEFFKHKEDSDLDINLYEEEHIDRMYYPYVVGKQPERVKAVIHDLAYDLIRRLGGERIQDIIEIIRHEGVELVEGAIFGYTREVCKKIKEEKKNDFHVLTLLYKQGGVRDTLKTAYHKCRPWISGNTKPIPGWSMSKDQRKFYIGIDHNHEKFGTFRDEMKQVVPAAHGLQVDFSDSADRTSIQFYTELAGYFAAWPSAMEKLKEKYIVIRKAGQDLHNDKNQYAFHDLFPLSDVERAELVEAHKALLLGTIMGILRVEERKVSAYKTEYTYVFDKQIAMNLKQPKYLGIEQAAIDELFNDTSPHPDRREILNLVETKYVWLKERGRLAELYALLLYYYTDVYKLEEVELEAGKKLFRVAVENDIILDYIDDKNGKIVLDIPAGERASFGNRTNELKGELDEFTTRIGHGEKRALDFSKLGSILQKVAPPEAEPAKVLCSNPSCGQPVQPHWKLCPACVQPIAKAELHCPNPDCGKPIQPHWKVCPECGSDLKTVDAQCPNCGEIVKPSWIECPECGAELLRRGTGQGSVS